MITRQVDDGQTLRSIESTIAAMSGSSSEWCRVHDLFARAAAVWPSAAQLRHEGATWQEVADQARRGAHHLTTDPIHGTPWRLWCGAKWKPCPRQRAAWGSGPSRWARCTRSSSVHSKTQAAQSDSTEPRRHRGPSEAPCDPNSRRGCRHRDAVPRALRGRRRPPSASVAVPRPRVYGAGEALGLRWLDVDLEAGMARIV